MSFKYIIQPLCDEFETLFCATFDNEKNVKFWQKLNKFIKEERWKQVLENYTHVQNRALANLQDKISTGNFLKS